MKNLLFIFGIFLSLQSHSQCRKTFLYGFELVGNVNPELVTATVFYKGKAIVPKIETICGKLLKIKTEFNYLKNSGKILDGVKLPYQLSAKCFYWLMTDEMNIEMATHPDRFKIVLNSKDKALKAKYELPVSYDFLSQNAIYLDLLDKSEANIKKEFKDKIWQFAIYEKAKKLQSKDTILVYSAREKIPEGVLMRFPEINVKTIHSTEEYSASGMLYKGKLFLKTSENKRPKPDAQSNFYISLDGKKCAASGGITGAGFGECAGATFQKNKKVIPYQVNVQIEP